MQEHALASDEELKQYGFSKHQIKYLHDVEQCVMKRKASCTDDVELGHGAVDRRVLEETFFE